jgi:hypothetical protein
MRRHQAASAAHLGAVPKMADIGATHFTVTAGPKAISRTPNAVTDRASGGCVDRQMPPTLRRRRAATRQLAEGVNPWARTQKTFPVRAWQDFLESLTKEREGDDVTIEVLTTDYGDQHTAEKLPFSYVEYDRKHDVVIVAVGGRDRRYPILKLQFVGGARPVR